jgi:hypothetical protein
MGSVFQHDLSGRANEREIVLLSDRNCASETDVRALFVSEFARLKMGAKVGAYLTVLTTSNVRGMLRRKAARLAAAADGTLR